MPLLQGSRLWGKNFQWIGMIGRIDALAWMQEVRSIWCTK
jgi:hypothetical protein